ncbi:sigma-54-dependent transcriptional regulator [Clostridium estertheticum]|uniref:Sigma-54 dependent transcriptional regulator n=1 Tax=Clostridium estertheticum TaxID=238834 RepID=A0AA47EHZ6_9CLOT|nr:sigma-54 dependent transcriptional regulator [Clostridium estertheticum]MBU3155374.1 sigma-54 dependent transcriptional regulator [Clostridium estertheticum]WAG60435.1 sigma-54 dependent transcriptional regulator [Clostridium estertheticum]
MGKILVIDDEEYIGWIIKKAFEGTDNEVYLTLNAKEGILEVQKSNFDVVFLDLRLKDMDGMVVLEKLKKIQKDIAVIIITAHGSIDTAIESMKKGAYDYITKPFDIEELIIQAEKAMELSHLRYEVNYLRSAEAKRLKNEDFISKNEKLNFIYKSINKIASSAATVLITGESGTGKELMARKIHKLSGRSKEPFIILNCGILSDDLAQREIFGVPKEVNGNNDSRKLGKLELANHGTIFLGDVGEMSLNMQVKFLRVIEEKEIQNAYGNGNFKIDVRVIASTNNDLVGAIEAGTFREDFYYKLNVVPINIPPLRDRKEDISELLHLFIKKYDLYRKIKGIIPEAMKLLKNYHWPGNIRELENVVERIVILATEPYIKAVDLPLEILGLRKKSKETIIYFPEEGINLENVERELIIKALGMSGYNQSKTAGLLGITRSALIYRMQKYNIN